MWLWSVSPGEEQGSSVGAGHPAAVHAHPRWRAAADQGAAGQPAHQPHRLPQPQGTSTHSHSPSLSMPDIHAQQHSSS